jgi:hypothetical protein
MIDHPSELGRVSAALALLGHPDLYIGTRDGSNAPAPYIFIVDGGNYHRFNTEEEVMVWLYQQIKEVAKSNIQWFEEHHVDTTRDTSTNEAGNT